jgi:hypothetical protein
MRTFACSAFTSAEMVGAVVMPQSMDSCCIAAMKVFPA